MLRRIATEGISQSDLLYLQRSNLSYDGPYAWPRPWDGSAVSDRARLGALSGTRMAEGVEAMTSRSQKMRRVSDSGDRSVYRAVFERDDNDTWLVRVPEVQGAHSFGKTLVRAERNIREALALVLDVDEDSFDMEREVRLPPKARAAVAEAQRYREIAAVSQSMSSTARARAVEALSGSFALGLRDVAELVGTSFQRIQQIRADPQREIPKAQGSGHGESAADWVDLMAALNVSVEAARRARRPSEAREDWSAVWTAMARLEGPSGEPDVSAFLAALEACVASIRRNLELIRWSVELPAQEA
jgi:predicted RNase H-like HicB family nuclease